MSTERDELEVLGQALGAINIATSQASANLNSMGGSTTRIRIRLEDLLAQIQASDSLEEIRTLDAMANPAQGGGGETPVPIAVPAPPAVEDSGVGAGAP
jgi:hypothetical protein